MEKRNKKGTHIGAAIERKIRERGMTYAEFARRLNVDRTTVYNIVRGNSIDTERLMRISKILEHDFIKLFYETDECDFVEIKKGYLINFANVTEMEDGAVVFENGTSITCSARKRRMIRDYFETYVEEHAR